MGKVAFAETAPALLGGAPQGFQDRASILLRASEIWSQEIETGLTNTQKELACGALIEVRDELECSSTEFSDNIGDVDLVETAEGIQSLSAKFGKVAIRQAVCEKFLVLPGTWADADYRSRPHSIISVTEILQSAGEGVIYQTDPTQLELHRDATDIVSFVVNCLNGVRVDRQQALLERSLTCVSAKAAVSISALLSGGSIEEIRKFTGYSGPRIIEGIDEFKAIFKHMLYDEFDPIDYLKSFSKLSSEAYNPLYLAAHIGLDVGPTERMRSISDRLLAWLDVQPFDDKTKQVIAGICGLTISVHMPLQTSHQLHGVSFGTAKSTIDKLVEYGPGVARAVIEQYADHGNVDDDVFARFDFHGGNCMGANPDELFVQGAEQNIAKRICINCPILADCLAFSLVRDEEFGVWGGATERERRARLKATSEGILMWAKNVLEATGYGLAA